MLQIWPDNKPLKDEKNIWKEHKIKKRSILFDKIEVENVIFVGCAFKRETDQLVTNFFSSK